MIQKTLLTLIISLSIAINLFSQNSSLDEYDIYIRDTLINKTDFIKNSNRLDSVQSKYVAFKPIQDGIRKIYYLSGQLSGEGEIKNKGNRTLDLLA